MHLTCHFTIPLGRIFSVVMDVWKVKINWIYEMKKDDESSTSVKITLGCYCNKNFILNKRTRKCQPAKSHYCGLNEYVGCGDSKCAKFCGSTRDYICDLSAFHCGYSCFCQPGFIKITNGPCIPVKDCPRYLIQQNFLI